MSQRGFAFYGSLILRDNGYGRGISPISSDLRVSRIASLFVEHHPIVALQNGYSEYPGRIEQTIYISTTSNKWPTEHSQRYPASPLEFCPRKNLYSSLKVQSAISLDRLVIYLS
ncbi:hypothetical protein HZ326_3501 [Fusarium oxysporum f. sp. albedinis]|nr:hypothetical protein HZ326_3501 [Fusarium oxysporum f. sp. albedinis]